MRFMNYTQTTCLIFGIIAADKNKVIGAIFWAMTFLLATAIKVYMADREAWKDDGNN